MKMFAAVLGLVAALGALATFGREYDVAFFARSSDLATFESLASGARLPQTPFSNRAMREVLMTCGAVQQGLLYALQPPEVQDRVDTSCTQIAAAVLVRNPTYAAAHTIVMFSAKDSATTIQSLIRSQATAPREAWHAKLRLRKGLPLYDSANTAAKRAIESDIAFLVQSFGGRSWLARLYKDKIAQRPVIVRVVEQRPNDEQVAFLREVRKLDQN